MLEKSLKLWLLAICTTFPVLVAAQSGVSISGIIRASDGKRAYNVSVHLKGTTRGVVSDTTGYYIIKDIEPGRYTVVFTHLNYKKDSVNVTLKSATPVQLDRQLRDNVAALAEIEIIGQTESEEIRQKPFEVNVIDIQPLQQRNLDINKILTQSSGVRVRQNAGLGSSFDLSLNGFKAAQFINGIPIEAYGSAYSFNSIPLNQVDRIEIFKGVVPVHLGGDALGGAINIVTKNKLSNSLNFAYSVGSFNTHKASVQGVLINPKTGFTAIASAFFNYSNNDYIMKDMIITDTATNTVYKKNVRRFHDDFLSYAVKAEIGLTTKKWADAFLVGTGFSGIRRDIQTGSNQYPAIGEARGEEDNYHVSVRYNKHSLLNGTLDLDGFILFNSTNTLFIDTASRVYQWDGTILTERPNSSSGEFENKQIYRTSQRDVSQRSNMDYHLTANQTISLNVISSQMHWRNTDPGEIEGTSVNDNTSDYSKTIVGLGYSLNLWDERFKSTAFVKYYRMNASVDSASRWRGGYFDIAPLETTNSFTGGGLGLSYIISKRVLAKVSAEYACRLPTVYELLGDGISTVANVSLKPETGMNYNIGFSAKLVQKSRISLTFNSSGFYRKAKDFIRATTGVKRSTHINYDAALVRGVESDIKLVAAQTFVFRANLSYQQVLDDNEYMGGTIPNYTYGIQLPNTPFLFGNLDAEHKIKKLFGTKLTIIPYYNLLYVEEFYLGYENIARGDYKYTIPRQLVHDIGLTLTDDSEKYSLSFECSNLTDALAYDNFRLQKTGRAFNFKITYNLY